MGAFTFAIDQAFDAAQCDAIVALGEGLAEAAPIWTGAGYDLDPDSRRAATSLRDREPETEWLFERLDLLFGEAAAHFGFEVDPLSEPVQILRYGEGDHFQRWHTDSGFDRLESRLVSVSVELSDASDYEGGLLEVVPDLVGRPRFLPRGGAIFFPSRALHHVAPVTRGVRRSLVAWTGKAG